jgi:O-antigen/teichoic acid export membrane protein
MQWRNIPWLFPVPVEDITVRRGERNVVQLLAIKSYSAVYRMRHMLYIMIPSSIPSMLNRLLYPKSARIQPKPKRVLDYLSLSEPVTLFISLPAQLRFGASSNSLSKLS